MRIVVDTNVFISSFFGGNPRKVIDLWKEGKVTLCLSQAILDEYIQVLVRMGLAEKQELSELLSLFRKREHLLYVAKPSEVKVVRSDPGDDKFIECAVALEAEAIVTGDKAILALGNYMRIKILSPQQFLKDYF